MSRKRKKAAEETPVANEEAGAETRETPGAEETTAEVISEETAASGEIPVEDAAAEEDLTEAIPADEEASAETAPEASPVPLKRIIESVLFATQKAISAKELITIIKSAAEAEPENPAAIPFAKIKEPVLRAAIEELRNDCVNEDRTYEVRESAAGWQLVTRPDFAPWLRQLYPENRSARLSAPAMETLAIIAYRQPITRADIEAVRGVAVDGVMQTLLDRGLVKIAGRAEIPGRPLLYETTQNFMEHFGLKNLDDLPNASELRKISLPTAAVSAETATPAENATSTPDGARRQGLPGEEAGAVESGTEPSAETNAAEAGIPEEGPAAAEPEAEPAIKTTTAGETPAGEEQPTEESARS